MSRSFGRMTRRQSLAATAIGTGTLLSRSLFGDDDKPSIPIIDCHTHFYDPSRPQGVPWPGKQDTSLYRTVLPASFKSLAKPLGVTGTIVVEASSWPEDNQWLLDLAAEDPFLLGIVGHIDISGDAFSEQVNRFARNPRFRGIRIGSGDISRGLMTGGKLIERCSQLADHNMELDVNGGPDTPQQVATLAAHLPKLRIVINHIGNLPINGKEPPAAWTEGIENAAKHPGVFCKVSALVEQTRTKPAPQDVAYYLPVLDRLWRAFGEDRLIFGSNWPVSDRGAPLETVVKIVREYFLTKGERAAAKFLAENAKAAYRWDD
ncbi:MAG: amidohydrolase family protein [Planctomycetaceae bacterium]